MMEEKIWFAEWQISQGRGKPGKVIRRMYSAATDGQVQDLAAFVTDGYSVQVTSDPTVWVEAYAKIRSCMIGKGELCAKAYTPHGVKIAVLRNAQGEICARMLVREGKAYQAYGYKAGMLVVVAHFLGNVEITPAWIDGFDVKVELRNQVIVTIDVPVYKKVKSAHPYFKNEWVTSHKPNGYRSLNVKGTTYKRPYVDGRGWH
jgi:hypothetical protein